MAIEVLTTILIFLSEHCGHVHYRSFFSFHIFQPLTREVGGTYLDLPEEFARGLPFPTKSGEPPWRTAAALCPAESLLEA